MKNLLMQARVVTDPVLNPLTGWWAEFYFWYIKHRDLNERDQLTQMMIDPSFTMPGVGARNDLTYTFLGGVDYVSMCLRRITETYFRDTGEAWNTWLIDSYPAAQITQQTFLDSALLESTYQGGTADNLVVGADDTITGSEISTSWLVWQAYRASNITTLSYEEYLATYGIPLPQGSSSEHRPELIRYVKDWSYPTNTINPADGTPTSAISWAIAERADKDRFFREPGFIFGACCIRPKVYFNGLYGAAVGALKDSLSWLPAVLGDNPEYSMRKFVAASGPIGGQTADYRIDLKDLFLYGEQYTNLAISTDNTSKQNVVGLPTPALQKKYPSASDASNCFKTPTVNKIRMDGVVSLNILGMQTETTPTRAPGTF